MTSGVYKITNNLNSKVYVGSSVNLKKRKSEHFYMLKYNRHSNAHLQNAYNKYGKEKFTLEVIEHVEDKGIIRDKENYWIKELRACDGEYGYNISKDASIPMLGLKLSEETIEKMRIAHTGDKNHFYGKKHTEESKKIIGLESLGRRHSNETKEIIREKGLKRKHSEESKKKMRENSPLKKKVINLTTGEEFNCLLDASLKHNISKSNIWNACNKYGRSKSAGGCEWGYVVKETYP